MIHVKVCADAHSSMMVSRLLFFRCATVALLIIASLVGMTPAGAAGARPTPTPSPSPIPAVIQVQVMRVDQAAAIIRQLFPHVSVRTDPSANAVVVVGPPGEVEQIRTVVQGLDVRNPNQPALEVVQLHTIKPDALVHKV